MGMKLSGISNNVEHRGRQKISSKKDGDLRNDGKALRPGKDEEQEVRRAVVPQNLVGENKGVWFTLNEQNERYPV